MKKFLLLLVVCVSSRTWAACTITDVLPTIRPNAQWVISNNDYATLDWRSVDSIKPTLDEIQAAIVDCPNQANLKERSDAINDFLTSRDDRSKLERAVLQVLFDENNNNREWIQAFKGQVSAATSLADLKARVSALPDMPDRTAAQAQAAVQNKVNSGASD